MKKYILISIYLWTVFSGYCQTGGFVNNGVRIDIPKNMKMDIDNGSYINNENGTIANHGTISLEGNWINNSSAKSVFSEQGLNSQIVFDGNSEQTISGQSNWNQLVLENNFQLNEDMYIERIISLEGSVLEMGNNNLIIKSGGEIKTSTNFSDENMIATNGDGHIIYEASQDGIYLFPIGDIEGTNNYTPISCEVNGDEYNGAFISAKVTNEKHPANENTQNFLNRYWTIDYSGISNPDFKATMNYCMDDVTGNEEYLSVKQLVNNDWITYQKEQNYVLVAEFESPGDFTAFGSSNQSQSSDPEDHFKINAVGNKLFITTDINTEDIAVNVFDALGHMVASSIIQPNIINSIDLPDLNFVLVNISTNEFAFSKKIVK